MVMVTSPKEVKAIANDEGTVLETYLDPIGIPTIGTGHTGKEAYLGNKITRKRALELLKEDLKEAEDVVNKHVKVELTQGQFDALVSFVFNVGPGRKGVKDGFVVLKNGRQSTLLRKINQGDFFGAAEEFPKWANAGGKKFRGLEIRRARERAQFLEGTVIKEPLDKNVEAEPNPKPSVSGSKPVQALTGTALAGALPEAAEQIAPLAEYSEYLRILWIVLVLASVGYFIYHMKKGD